MFCNKCGEKIEEGYPVCMKCGNQVGMSGVQREKEETRRKKDKKVLIIIIIIIFILMLLSPFILMFTGMSIMKSALKDLEKYNVTIDYDQYDQKL